MRTIVIAEAGVNHNGNIQLAQRLIDTAAEAGADYIKFQTFVADRLVTRKAGLAEYQERNSNDGSKTQYTMLKKLELSQDDHYILQDYCKRRNITFLSTAFDLPSLEFLSTLNLDFAKIPSGEITNIPYLRKVGSLFDRVVLSTGMSTIDDIKTAIDILVSAGMYKEKITVLHCNTEYPTPMKDVNLKAMLHIQKEFGVAVGYSDHTLGIEIPIAAVALGASVIEKHFTLDRFMEGPDHRASLEPAELKAMVQAIRNVEEALSGSGVKGLSDSEKQNIAIVRKSIVASCDIKKGEVFTENNVAVKRPGGGLSPLAWDTVIGEHAKKDFMIDEMIEL